MVGRQGSSKSRSVGRYDLVVEMAKSLLGSLWAASAPSEMGPETRSVRIITTGTKDGSGFGALEQVAKWSRGFEVDQALAVLDVVPLPSELGLVSGYVPGETLRSLFRLSNFKRQDLPLRVALRITADTCEALLAAETRALAAALAPEHFYGGLLPDSLLIGTDGVTRLMDIGVAATWRVQTNAIEHADVAAYSAPEQLESNPLDARTDVFILGIMLWEMLSGGKRLFVGSSGPAVCDKILNQPISQVTPSQASEQIPEPVQSLLSKMLERDPRRRFRSLTDLKQALESQVGKHVGLAIEVSDFVTTFAHNSITSRERLLDRALDRPTLAPAGSRPSHPPPAAISLTPAGPEVALPAPLPPLNPPSRHPSPPPRSSAPDSMPLAPPPPLRLPEARAGVKPLPLPAQAKLKGKGSGDVVPPPPPPVVPRNPKLPASAVDGGDQDSSSVRAADILRALAMEDPVPVSDQQPTRRLPPPPPSARAASEPARARDSGLSRPVQETLVGHASPVPPPTTRDNQERPLLETLPGYVLEEPAVTVEVPPAVADSTPGAASPPGVAAAPSPRPTASGPSHAPFDQPVAPLPAGATDERRAGVAATPTNDVELVGPFDVAPARSPERRPRWLLVAACAGGALVVALVLIFAVGGGTETDSGAKAGVDPATLDPSVQKKAKPAFDSATAETSPRAPAEEKTPPATPPEPEAIADDTVAKTEPAAAEESENDDTGAANLPTPAPVAQAVPKTAPATPMAQPGKRKLRAKRSFIPSGI